MEAGLVYELRRHQAQPAQHLDADRDAAQRRWPVGAMPLAGRKHRRHDYRASMHRAAFESIVEVFAVCRRAVDESRAGGAERARVPDDRARAVVVDAGERALDVVFVARREAEPHHVDQQLLALCPHGYGQARRIDGCDARGEFFGDGLGGRIGGHETDQLLRRRDGPEPGIWLMKMTTMKVRINIESPSTEMAPRSPLSLRSKISTETTLVSEVNSMTAAESSRMVETKMKHQVASTLVRNRGAVTWRSACSRVAPRMRLASSSSGCTDLKADCRC